MAKEEGSGADVPMKEEVSVTSGFVQVQTIAWPQQPQQHQGRKAYAQKFAGVAKPKPISNAVKKKRNNFRLRRIILPKSPIMVLNEMVGQVSYTFMDNPPVVQAQMLHGMPPMYTAQCAVDGQTFTGTGPSKQIAKNMSAEHAVQAFVVKKCVESRERRQQTNVDGAPPLRPNQMEDETPWAQLASMSLFKLFNEWEGLGYEIPPELWKAPDQAEPGTNEEPKAQVKMQQPSKKVPENPTSRHPVQLLNELRGQITYNLVSETGNPPNCVFTIGTTIDGKEFTGEGRNKKDAKRNCAVDVLKDLHDIVYPESATPMKVP